MMTSLKIAILLTAGLVLPGTALAPLRWPRGRKYSCDAKRRRQGARLIGVSQTVDAKGCKKGWCQVAGGYVQTSYLRFIRVSQRREERLRLQRAARSPALRLYPGFWGYGGRRYYDQFGNYAKYGQRGYAGPPSEFDTQPVETRRRGLFGPR